MIELDLLGPIRLRGDDGRELNTVLAQPKRLALLGYLAAAHPAGFHRRDKLVALFWPDFDQGRARQALNKSVHQLRQILGDDTIVSRGDQEIAVDPDRLRCDVRQFEDALPSAPESGLALYRGEFCDGLYVDDAPAFDQWLSIERDRLRLTAVKAIASLADSPMLTGTEQAVEWARRGVALAPFDEVAARRLMRALDRVGDRSGAVLAYDELAARLKNELDVEPAFDTRALRESLSGTGIAAHAPLPVPAPVLVVAGSPEAKPRRARLGIIVAAAAATIIVAFAASRFRTLPASSALDPNRVVVAVLENRTGDSTLDPLGPMAMDWMRQGLANAEMVRVAEQRALTPTGIRALADSSGAGQVISGAYYRDGDSVRFQVTLTDVKAGAVSRAFQPVSSPVSNPLGALESLRQQALSIVAQASVPQLATLLRGSARPPSYAAYLEYMAGLEATSNRDGATAYRHFMRAAQLDTGFVVALLYAVSSLQTPGQADSVIDRLNAHRDQLGGAGRVWLDAILATRRNDPVEALSNMRELAQKVPESPVPYYYATSLIANKQVRRGVAVLHDINPERGFMKGWRTYWVAVGMADHILGDEAAERADVAKSMRQYPGIPSSQAAEARYLAATGQRAAADSLFDAAATTAPIPEWNAGSVFAVGAVEAAAHGHEDWVPSIRARALVWYASLTPSEREHEAPVFGLTWVLHSVGAWPELEARVEQLAKAAPTDLRWLTFRALIAAHRGDTTTARSIDRTLADLAATPGPRQPILVASRARIAAMLGDRKAAIELLSEALAHGFPFSGYMHTEPSLASLHDDEAFKRLITPID
jgi:DNA-binding SARP family transcriptional activator